MIVNILTKIVLKTNKGHRDNSPPPLTIMKQNIEKHSAFKAGKEVSKVSYIQAGFLEELCNEESWA